jgi:hypothetical protein
MSTIAMVEGGPTCDTLDDAAFIRFYGNRPGWDEHRAYTVVAGEAPDKTCGLYNAEEDLFLASKIDGAAMDYWGAFPAVRGNVYIGRCTLIRYIPYI